MIDLVARDSSIDPVEVRRRNMIPAEEMPYAVGIPYRDGVPVVYDSGDFPRALERAIEALGGSSRFATSRRRRGAGPLSRPRHRLLCRRDRRRAVRRRDHPDRSIRQIYRRRPAPARQGQGHETVFAQVAADEWGVSPDDVTVVDLRHRGDRASATARSPAAARSIRRRRIRLASGQLRKKVLRDRRAHA